MVFYLFIYIYVTLPKSTTFGCDLYSLFPHIISKSSSLEPRILLPWAQDTVASLSDLVLMIYDVKKEEFGHVVFLWAIVGILSPAFIQ